MDPAELERDIDQALRRLPQPRAPHTLVVRVMNAIAAPVAAPIAEIVPAGWRAWPLALQLLSLVLVVSAGVGVVWIWPAADAWVTRVTAAPLIVWRTLLQPLAVPAIGVLLVMCVAAALFGAALKHVAWEGQRTSHS
jgi:hypothetical protein